MKKWTTKKWKKVFILNFLCLIAIETYISIYGISGLMQVAEIMSGVGIVVSYYGLAKEVDKVL